MIKVVTDKSQRNLGVGEFAVAGIVELNSGDRRPSGGRLELQKVPGLGIAAAQNDCLSAVDGNLARLRVALGLRIAGRGHRFIVTFFSADGRVSVGFFWLTSGLFGA